MGIQMKNPGAVSDATGAIFKTGNFGKPTTIAELRATQDRHARACNMLKYVLGHHALAVNAAEAWSEFANIAFIRLSEDERHMLAYQILRTLKPRTRQRVFEAAQWGLHHEA